jgi:hypothetical protein
MENPLPEFPDESAGLLTLGVPRGGRPDNSFPEESGSAYLEMEQLTRVSAETYPPSRPS